MADRTVGGASVAADERQQEIRLRRLQHEGNAMRVSIEKFQIDILEAKATIGRLEETIVATRERIATKEAEFAEANSS